MVGNAMEEGIISQIGNPSHLDRGRVIVPAVLIAGLIMGHLVWSWAPFANLFLALFVGAAVCGMVAWRLSSTFEVRELVRASAENEARCAVQIAETERKLAAMRGDT